MKDKWPIIILVIILVVAIIIGIVYFLRKDEEDKQTNTNTNSIATDTNSNENTNTNTNTSDIQSSQTEVEVDNGNVTTITKETTVSGDDIKNETVIGSTDANYLKEILEKYDYISSGANFNKYDYEITLPDGTKYYVLDDVNGVIKDGKLANISEADKDKIENILEKYELYD